MRPLRWAGLLLAFALALLAAPAHAADDFWLQPGPDGKQQVRLYFFWSLTCPHCERARPFVETIPEHRPWVALQSLEVSRNPQNAAFYRDIVSRVGQDAGVPGFLLCGELRIGWHQAETAGAELEQALDACHRRVLAGNPAVAGAAPPPPERIDLPVIGAVDPATLSLPVLTLAGHRLLRTTTSAQVTDLEALRPCSPTSTRPSRSPTRELLHAPALRMERCSDTRITPRAKGGRGSCRVL